MFVYELIPSGNSDEAEDSESIDCESADLDTKVERVRKKRSMFEKASSTAPALSFKKSNVGSCCIWQPPNGLF